MGRSVISRLLGVFVATTTAFSEPVIAIGFPANDERPADLTFVNPVGATTDATESNRRWEVTSDATNVTDPSGLEGGRPMVTGTPATTTSSLDIDAKQGGEPDRTATYTWTDSQGTYGQTNYDVPARFDTVAAALTGDGYRQPRGVALPNGDIVCIFEDWATAGADFVKVRKWDAGTRTWGSAVTVVDIAGTYAYPLAFATSEPTSPEIVAIPSDTSSGVVLVAFWLETISADTVQLKFSHSTDDGATWSARRDTNLYLSYDNAPTLEYDEMRIAYEPYSQTMYLLLRENDNATYTGRVYKSYSRGSDWEAVPAMDRTGLQRADMVAHCQSVYLAWSSATTAINVQVATGASAAWVSRTTDAHTSQDIDLDQPLTLTVDTGGRLFAAYRVSGAEYTLMGISSTDAGMTWGGWSEAYPANSLPTYGILEDATSGVTLVSGIVGRSLVYSAGRLHLLGNLRTSGGGTADYSIGQLIWGDRSTLTRNRSQAGATLAAIAPYYYPTDTPNTKGGFWTENGASVFSRMAAANGRIVLDISNAASTGYVSQTAAVTDERLSVSLGISAESTSAAAIPILRVAQNDGVNEVIVDLYVDFTARTARLYDVVAAAYIGASAINLNSGDTDFYLEIDANTSVRRVSAWHRSWAEDDWTTIGSDLALTAQVGVNNYVYVGKVTNTTSNVKVLYWGAASDSGLARGNVSGTLKGVQAYSLPDTLIDGVSVAWVDGVLHAGNGWAANSLGAAPIRRINPWHQEHSPSLQWISDTGAAGATYRIVYDRGANWKGLPNDLGMQFIAFDNAYGIAEASFDTWSGAAWTQRLIITGHDSPFGAAGSVAFSRDSTGSYTFRPYGANGNPRVLERDELVGLYCIVGDAGGDIIAGRIASNSAGQFSSTSKVLQASFTLDPTTVTALAGSLATLATAETTGSIVIYPSRAMAVGVLAAESTRYISYTITLASGLTVANVGLLFGGGCEFLARQCVAGSREEWAGHTDTAVLPNGIAVSQRNRRVAQRTLTIPYAQILSQTGMGEAGAVNTLGYNTTTARAGIDNNLHTIRALQAQVGSGVPIAVMLDRTITGEPGTTQQVAWGRDVMIGRVGQRWTRTTSHGTLYGRGHGHENGFDLTIEEVL